MCVAHPWCEGGSADREPVSHHSGLIKLARRSKLFLLSADHAGRVRSRTAVVRCSFALVDTGAWANIRGLIHDQLSKVVIGEDVLTSENISTDLASIATTVAVLCVNACLLGAETRGEMLTPANDWPSRFRSPRMTPCSIARSYKSAVASRIIRLSRLA